MNIKIGSHKAPKPSIFLWKFISVASLQRTCIGIHCREREREKEIKGRQKCPRREGTESKASLSPGRNSTAVTQAVLKVTLTTYKDAWASALVLKQLCLKIQHVNELSMSMSTASLALNIEIVWNIQSQLQMGNSSSCECIFMSFFHNCGFSKCLKWNVTWHCICCRDVAFKTWQEIVNWDVEIETPF